MDACSQPVGATVGAMEIDGGGGAGHDSSRHRENSAAAPAPADSTQGSQNEGALGQKAGKTKIQQLFDQLTILLRGKGTFEELDASAQGHLYKVVEVTRQIINIDASNNCC